MNKGTIEHANITVSDPDAMAEQLCRIFNWSIRWSGENDKTERTVHVGNEHTYLALYRPVKISANNSIPYESILGLNHMGVVVENLNEIEVRITKEGLVVHHRAEYSPGRRLYFKIQDNFEFEAVQYGSS